MIEEFGSESRSHKHDVRTRLHQIIGFSDLLFEDLDADAPPGLAAELTSIRAAAVLAVQLVDEISADTAKSAPSLQEQSRHTKLADCTRSIASASARAMSRCSGLEQNDLRRINTAAAELCQLLAVSL